jgi:5-methylcytosine-specific restriction endonuclease McrA
MLTQRQKRLAKARHDRWYARHRDEILAKRRRKYASDPEILEYDKAWKRANRSSCAASARRWRRRNPEKLAAKIARYKLAHPEVVDTCRRNYEARRRGAEGRLTTKEWQSILERFDGRCAYCRKPSRRLQREHVIPLSRGGRNDASNVVPACWTCNRRKWSRTPEEWRAAEAA